MRPAACVPACLAIQDVVRGFKTQMNEARGLKETSEPEFQDKYSRIVELRNLRSSYIKRMKTIRENLSAFDCKSEAELDEKIRAIEHRITHEVSCQTAGTRIGTAQRAVFLCASFPGAQVPRSGTAAGRAPAADVPVASLAVQGVALREEKQLVQQVAKLNAIRPKLKEYEPLKAELTELETEANKVRGLIGTHHRPQLACRTCCIS